MIRIFLTILSVIVTLYVGFRKEIKQELISYMIEDNVPYSTVFILKNKQTFIPSMANAEFPDIKMSEMNKWQDYEWLAKLLYTERVNVKDPDELRYIAATALNRALMKNQKLKRVCQNRKQYSGVMRNHNKNWKRQPTNIHKYIAYEMIQVYKQGIPEKYGGVYAFCNAKWVARNNPKAMRWFNTMKKVNEFKVPNHGTHSFYKNRKWDRWVMNNPNALLTNSHLS